MDFFFIFFLAGSDEGRLPCRNMLVPSGRERPPEALWPFSIICRHKKKKPGSSSTPPSPETKIPLQRITHASTDDKSRHVFGCLSIILWNTLECLALFFSSSVTILTSSADLLQWGRCVLCARWHKPRTLITVSACPPACGPAGPAVCTKQDKCDGNCNAITKDKSHPLDFELSSIRTRTRTHARTSAVRAGAAHFRPLTGGCGSYRDEWWLD